MSNRPTHDLITLSLVDGVNMISDATTVTFERGNETGAPADELTLGTLTATVLGAGFNPATNPAVRPGRTIFAKGYDHTGTLRTLWAGRLNIPTVSYDRDGRATVSLGATDVIKRLEQTLPVYKKHRSGNFNRKVNDATATLTGAYPIGRVIEGAPISSDPEDIVDAGGINALERLKIALNDHDGSWLWASRSHPDHINGRDMGTAGFPSTAPVWTFTDEPTDVQDTVADTVSPRVEDPHGTFLHYTDITIAHDAEQFVNSLTIEKLSNYNGTTIGEHGPFLDEGTMADWGRLEGRITVVHGFADLTATARRAMARRAIPSAAVKTITVDVLKNPAVLAQDLIYVPVRVKHEATAHDSVYRILRESHTVGPRSWEATYTVRPIEPWRDITITTD